MNDLERERAENRRRNPEIARMVDAARDVFGPGVVVWNVTKPIEKERRRWWIEKRRQKEKTGLATFEDVRPPNERGRPPILE